MKPGAAVGGPTGQQHLYVSRQHATGSTAAVLPAGPWLVIEDSGGIGADFAVRPWVHRDWCAMSLHRTSHCMTIRSERWCVRTMPARWCTQGLDTPPLGSAADPVAAQ